VLTIADRDDDRYLGAMVLIARGAEIGELAYLVAPWHAAAGSPVVRFGWSGTGRSQSSDLSG
jgi:hypothetical protein